MPYHVYAAGHPVATLRVAEHAAALALVIGAGASVCNDYELLAVFEEDPPFTRTALTEFLGRLHRREAEGVDRRRDVVPLFPSKHVIPPLEEE